MSGRRVAPTTPRRIVKAVAEWVLPAGLHRSVSGWRHRPRLSAADKAILTPNADWKGRHQGERCFVLATGPSIADQDLGFLEDETCIAVSNFIAHPEFDVIRPEYYCLAPRHDPITDEQWVAWMSEIDGRAPFSHLFMSLSDRRLNEENDIFRGRVNYLHFDSACQGSIADLTATLTPPQSVSVMALMVAVYMGFEEIYLLGCDHSWLAHVGEGAHFYKEDQHKMVELGFNEWFKPSVMEGVFLSHLRLWRQYKLFLEMDEDFRIFNLSPTSLLDLFPKIDLEELKAVRR